jgi:hypothetical protein
MKVYCCSGSGDLVLHVNKNAVLIVYKLSGFLIQLYECPT